VRTALLTLFVLILAGVTTASAAPRSTHEPYTALQAQIAAGKVQQASVVAKTRIVRVKLKNGAKYVARYPKGADPTAALKAHGAHVRVKKVKAASSHVRVRYIVLGVLAGLALVGGAFFYYFRRRRPTSPPAP
jgi:LPXTG-motif cell wall-anchored protein